MWLVLVSIWLAAAHAQNQNEATHIGDEGQTSAVSVSAFMMQHQACPGPHVLP